MKQNSFEGEFQIEDYEKRDQKADASYGTWPEDEDESEDSATKTLKRVAEIKKEKAAQEARVKRQKREAMKITKELAKAHADLFADQPQPPGQQQQDNSQSQGQRTLKKRSTRDRQSKSVSESSRSGSSNSSDGSRSSVSSDQISGRKRQRLSASSNTGQVVQESSDDDMTEGTTRRHDFCSTHPAVSYLLSKTKHAWKGKLDDESSKIFFDSIVKGLEELEVDKQILLESSVHKEMILSYFTDLNTSFKGTKPAFWEHYTFRQHGEFLVRALANKATDLDIFNKAAAFLVKQSQRRGVKHESSGIPDLSSFKDNAAVKRLFELAVSSAMHEKQPTKTMKSLNKKLVFLAARCRQIIPVLKIASNLIPLLSRPCEYRSDQQYRGKSPAWKRIFIGCEAGWPAISQLALQGIPRHQVLMDQQILDLMSKYDYLHQQIVFLGIGWRVSTQSMNNQILGDLLEDLKTILDTVATQSSTADCLHRYFMDKQHLFNYTFEQFRDIMIYCCNTFSAEQMEKRLVKHKGNFIELINSDKQIKGGRSTKTSESVDLQKVQESLELLIKADGMNDLFDDVMKTSKIIEAGDSFYKAYYFQAYVVATLMGQLKNTNKIATKIAPGQGKSSIQILLVAFLNKFQQQRICLVNPNSDLKHQLKKDFDEALPQAANLTFIDASSEEIPDADIYLLDEADLIIQQANFECDEDELKGLFRLINPNKACIFMSATFSDTQQKFMKTFYSIDDVQGFPTMYQLSQPMNASADHYDIKYFAGADQKTILNQVNKDLHNLLVVQKKPVLVFADSTYTNSTVEEALKAVAQPAGILFFPLDSYQTVCENKQAFENLPVGLLLADKSLSRGISLKMAKDAFVMILCHGKSREFNIEDVRQMVGRGNRSFGKCEGKVYMEDVVLSVTNQVESALKFKPKEISPQAYYILGAAIKTWYYFGYSDHVKQRKQLNLCIGDQDQQWKTADWNALKNPVGSKVVGFIKSINSFDQLKYKHLQQYELFILEQVEKFDKTLNSRTRALKQIFTVENLYKEYTEPVKLVAKKAQIIIQQKDQQQLNQQQLQQQQEQLNQQQANAMERLQQSLIGQGSIAQGLFKYNDTTYQSANPVDLQGRPLQNLDTMQASYPFIFDRFSTTPTVVKPPSKPEETAAKQSDENKKKTQ